LLTSSELTADPERSSESSRILAEDLRGHGIDDLAIVENTSVEVPGFGHLIAPVLAVRDNRPPIVVLLDHPFAPGTPLAEDWREAVDLAMSSPIIHVDELIVRRNLPYASRTVISGLGYET
jgi:hypothetical protein